MIEILKKIAQQTAEQASPMAVLFGAVKSVSPLRVRIEDRFELDEDFLIVPKEMLRKTESLTHSHPLSGGSTGTALGELVIREGLSEGDTVLLLRNYGGQKYLVIGRV